MTTSQIPDLDLGSPLLPPIPPELAMPWPHQVPAIKDIVDAFASGARVVVLDGPPGTGKTLIAEHVRRALMTKALYLCGTKQLQAQVCRSFPYAKLIMGRDNYPTLDDFTRSAKDCDSFRSGCKNDNLRCVQTPVGHCSFCHPTSSCPYLQAKASAVQSPLAVANTAYAFAEWNAEKSVFKDYPLLILDEWDDAERMIVNSMSLSMTTREIGRFGIKLPKDGVTEKWVRGLLEKVNQLIVRLEFDPPDDWLRIKALSESLTAAANGLQDQSWIVIRSDEDLGIEIGPISIEKIGMAKFWSKAKRWLLMSGTAIDVRFRMRALGWSVFGTGEARLVRVPSVYPVKSRPVWVWPVASMVAKSRDVGVPLQARAIEKILDRHQSERVLIHSGTYAITESLRRELGLQYQSRMISFVKPREREEAMAKFLAQDGAVLMGPAMERGLDLPDAACRVVVICRVPYAYQGDPRVAERAKSPGFWTYQAIEQISTLVQMTGRAMRHKDDYATSYILDRQFLKIWTHGLYSSRWPDWWIESVQKFDGTWA